MREGEGDTGNQEAADNRSVRWPFIASGAWLLVVAGLLFATSTCESGAFWNLYARHLTCLSANELGDFLAGAFAPLAFLWLVAAVLVQAKELDAQRRELRLTRKEYELHRTEITETRKEIAAQADAARRSAEFMKEQTDFQREQLRQLKAAEADQQLSRMLDQLNVFIRTQIADKIIVWQKNNKGSAHIIRSKNIPDDRDQGLVYASREFARVVNANMNSHVGAFIPSRHSGVFAELMGLLNEVITMGNDTSLSNLMLLRTIQVEELRDALREAIMLTTEDPDPGD